VSIANSIRYAAHHPIVRLAPARVAMNIIGWQVRSRISTDPFEVDWLMGTRLVAERGMTGATGNIYFGLWEFHDMGFALHFMRPGDLFCDIGANIGSYSILAAGIVGARTVSFEPDIDTARHLHRNIRANRLDDLVSIRELALASTEGELALSAGRGPMNQVVAGLNANARMVRASTLDAQLDGEVPTMLKVDVEGFELEVVRGGHDTLAAPMLKAVAVETEDREVLRILKDYGFATIRYDPFTRALVRGSSAEHHNHLLVRDVEWVRERVEQASTVDVFGHEI